MLSLDGWVYLSPNRRRNLNTDPRFRLLCNYSSHPIRSLKPVDVYGLLDHSLTPNGTISVNLQFTLFSPVRTLSLLLLLFLFLLLSFLFLLLSFLFFSFVRLLLLGFGFLNKRASFRLFLYYNL